MRLIEDKFGQAPLNEIQLERIGKAYAHLTTLVLDCEPESITAFSDIIILPRWTGKNSEQRGAQHGFEILGEDSMLTAFRNLRRLTV